MKGIFFLAWRYISFHRLKSFILVFAMSLVVFLPLSVHLLINIFQKSIEERAASTPLLIGSSGNRYDLVLRSIYFQGEEPTPLSQKEVEDLSERKGAVIPLFLRFSAHRFYAEDSQEGSYQSFPLVGTTLDYFFWRSLEVKEGNWPAILGEVVVGPKVAENLNLRLGDFLLSDQQKIYDISSTYPLKMKVVGILKEEGTADDEAIFTDIKTSWIIAGIGHGHQDVLDEKNLRLVQKKEGSDVLASPRMVNYNEVTMENIASFHFHGESQNFPVSSIVFLPKDHKAMTILMGDYLESKTVQVVSPKNVVGELMSLVFRIRIFFDANFILMFLCTVLFLSLILLLSFKLRERERKTFFKLGCSRRTVISVQLAELFLLGAFSALLVILGAWGLWQSEALWIKLFFWIA